MDPRHSIDALRMATAFTDSGRCYSQAPMKTSIVVALLCGCAASGAAVAETLVVNDQLTVPSSSVDTPKRGSTMTEVEKHFGAPVEKHATVGQPPITRWDYTGFSVFFE